MDAAATEHFRAYLLAVVADLTASVIAVYGAVGSTVVSSADDLVVFDDDRTHCFFQARRSFF